MTETVFEDGYSKEHIKEKMNKVLLAYQFESIEDNYNRLGSAQVAMCKDSKRGVAEMQILVCMIKSKKKAITTTIAIGLGYVLRF